MIEKIFRFGLSWSLAVAALILGARGSAVAQTNRLTSPSIVHNVRASNGRLEMTVNESRILTLDHKIPQFQVNNPDILTLTALSPTQIQLHAKQAGVTQVNIWDEQEKVYSLDVIVFGDARELSVLLESEFPNCSLRIKPMSSGVLISGYVDRPDHVTNIIEIAEEYYPKVLSNITVGGVHQVLLHVKAMEVSRTKLRRLGIDWQLFADDAIIRSTISGLLSSVTRGIAETPAGSTWGYTEGLSGSPTFAFGVLNGPEAFFGFIEALRDDNLMKVLAEPTLVTVSGRPAYFQVGGEIPLLIPQGLGQVSIQYKKYGTQVDFVPIVLGNGRIRLEVRPRVSEIDSTRSVVLDSLVIPGLRVREVDTGVEMMAGQTLAIAGLVQNRIEANKRGLPWVSDLPYIGALFRRVEERNNEVELLVLVTPELVEAMDAHEVPPCGPGLRTASPNDCELYLKGHLEVPRCCPQCPTTGQPLGSAPFPTRPAMTPGAVTTPPEPAPLPDPPRPTLQPAPSEAAASSATIRVPQPTRAQAGSSARQKNLSIRQVRHDLPDTSKKRELPGFIGPVGYDAPRE
jgi:pilus assembly protein CpaC